MRPRTLVRAILFSLPFTRSCTLPVGFPLKLYEPLVPLGLAAVFHRGRMDTGRASRFLQWWLLFWLASLASTTIGFTFLDAIDLSVFAWAHGRYDPLVNAIFHTVYLGLDIALLALLLAVLRQGDLDADAFVRDWLLGTRIAVAYGLALNGIHALGLPAALLGRFDADLQVIHVAGMEVVRTGPFEEGNYFGLYLLSSLVLLLWRWPARPARSHVITLLAVAVGILMTASPAAVFLGAAILCAHALRPETRGAMRWTPVLLAVGIGAAVVGTDLFQEIVLEKFSLLFYGGVVASDNVSLFMRINESHHAWRLFLDHPFGVGIGAFGYFWGEHPEFYPWMSVPFSTEKLIPNNVWLEILSEQGAVGMLLFLGAMGTLVRGLRRRRQGFLLVGLGAMLVYFVAFPSFRLMFLWAFWALLAHVASGDADARLGWSDTDTPPPPVGYEHAPGARP